MTRLWRYAGPVAVSLFVLAASLVAGQLANGQSAKAETWVVTERLSIGSVTGAVIAPNGHMAALLQASPARVDWVALPSGRELGSAPLPQPPVDAVFSADGSALVASYADCAYVARSCTHGSDVSVLAVGAAQAVTVTIGPGAGLLAAVPGSTDVLVADSGRATVSVLDVQGNPSVVHGFNVSAGVLAGLAVSSNGAMAAVSNATHGTVTLLNLATGQVGATGSVPGAAGPVCFSADGTSVWVGNTAGDTAWQFRLPRLPRDLGVALTNGVGRLLCLQNQPTVAAASLHAQTVAASYLFVSRYGATGANQRVVSIGIPARGHVSGLQVVDGGQELLATAQRGVAVIVLGSFSNTRLIQLIRPKALGGVPIGLAAGPGRAAVVPTTGGVDVLGVRS